MFDNHKRFATRFVPLLLGLGALGIAAGASQAGSTGNSASQPVQCEIQATATGGMIALQGIVHSDVATSGAYTFKVASAGGSGNTNIQQGGGFQAGPDAPAMLGKVMLGNTGNVYDAKLKITSNGKTFECAERVGGNI